MPRPRVYSVPRRYDLSTMFAVSLGYAVMFGGMRLAGFPAETFAIVASFVTVVGLAQALLFRGQAPRAASAVAGVVYCLAANVAIGLWHSFALPEALFGAICFGVFWGGILGYLAGVLVGAVFLVAELTRTFLQWYTRR